MSEEKWDQLLDSDADDSEFSPQATGLEGDSDGAVEEETPQEPEPETPAEPVQESAVPTNQTPDGPPAEELLKQYVADLESSYSIPEELSEKLQTEPEKVLPKLAAQVHMRVAQEIYRYMQAQLPEFIDGYVQTMSREMQAKQAFFSKWPDLAPYEDKVVEIGMMYRKMNPKASPDEVIQRVGELATNMLGLNKQQPQQRPFRPAAPGSSGSNQLPKSKSKWELLMED